MNPFDNIYELQPFVEIIKTLVNDVEVNIGGDAYHEEPECIEIVGKCATLVLYPKRWYEKKYLECFVFPQSHWEMGNMVWEYVVLDEVLVGTLHDYTDEEMKSQGYDIENGDFDFRNLTWGVAAARPGWDYDICALNKVEDIEKFINKFGKFLTDRSNIFKKVYINP